MTDRPWVFCMFSEDVGLLPGHMFTRMLRHAHPASERFPELAGELFRGMASRRRIGSRPWPGSTTACSTNGVPLPLERSDIETVLASVGPRRVGDRPVDPRNTGRARPRRRKSRRP